MTSFLGFIRGLLDSEIGVVECWNTAVAGSEEHHSNIPVLHQSSFISSSRFPVARRDRQNLWAAPVLLLALCRQESRARLECRPTSDRAPAETAASRFCNCTPELRCRTYACISKVF